MMLKALPCLLVVVLATGFCSRQAHAQPEAAIPSSENVDRAAAYPPSYGPAYPAVYPGTRGAYPPSYPSSYPPAYPPSVSSTVAATDRCPGGAAYNPVSVINEIVANATGGNLTYITTAEDEGTKFYLFSPVGADCSLGMIFEVIVSPAPAGHKPKMTNLTWDLTTKYDTLDMFTGDELVLTWTGFHGVSMMVLPEEGRMMQGWTNGWGGQVAINGATYHYGA